jgi:hypothetical protein
MPRRVRARAEQFNSDLALAEETSINDGTRIFDGDDAKRAGI